MLAGQLRWNFSSQLVESCLLAHHLAFPLCALERNLCCLLCNDISPSGLQTCPYDLSSVQFSSIAQSCPTLCDPMNRSTPGLSVSPTPRVYSNSCPSSWWCHQPSHPLPSLSPPTPNPSQNQGLFQRVNSWHQYWSFSFSISPSNEHPGLISFTMDWLDLPAVQGTLKSLLQHHSSKASILWRSAFFIIQLLHPYMTTEKTIALTRWTFVGNVSAF